MAIFGHFDHFDITTPVAKISQNLKIIIFFCSTYIGEWKPHSAFFIYAFFQFSTHPSGQQQSNQTGDAAGNYFSSFLSKLGDSITIVHD